MNNLLVIALACSSLLLSSQDARSASADAMRDCKLGRADELLDRSYRYDRTRPGSDAPADIPTTIIGSAGVTTLAGTPPDLLKKSVGKAPSRGQLIFLVKKPEGMPKDFWDHFYVYGAAQTEEKKPGDIEPVATESIGVSIRDRNADQAMLDVTLPSNRHAPWSVTNWTLVALVCGGPDNRVIGFGSQRCVSSPRITRSP